MTTSNGEDAPVGKHGPYGTHTARDGSPIMRADPVPAPVASPSEGTTPAEQAQYILKCDHCGATREIDDGPLFGEIHNGCNVGAWRLYTRNGVRSFFNVLVPPASASRGETPHVHVWEPVLFRTPDVPLLVGCACGAERPDTVHDPSEEIAEQHAEHCKSVAIAAVREFAKELGQVYDPSFTRETDHFVDWLRSRNYVEEFRALALRWSPPQCSNGSTECHEPGVLPQGMTFHAGELADAYVAGARSARAHHPVTDEQIVRACDAYVKLAHLNRIDR